LWYWGVVIDYLIQYIMSQENQLQNVIDLIERTGDKAVVLENGRPAYVLMRLRDYEGLILGKSGVQGLTKDEMQDKINREIAIWKSDQEKLEQLEEGALEIQNAEFRMQNSDMPGVDDWDDDEEGAYEPEVPFGLPASAKASVDRSADPWEDDRRRRALDMPDFEGDERAELDDHDFDPTRDVEIPQFEPEKDDELPPFDVAQGLRPSDFEKDRADLNDDEFDVDKEMKKMVKKLDKDTPKSRFEEDRFYVEPVE